MAVKAGGGGAISTRAKVALIDDFQRTLPMRFPEILRIIRENYWDDQREFSELFRGICATSATKVKFPEQSACSCCGVQTGVVGNRVAVSLLPNSRGHQFPGCRTTTATGSGRGPPSCSSSISENISLDTQAVGSNRMTGYHHDHENRPRNHRTAGPQ
jgi:hypothetical protein